MPRSSSPTTVNNSSTNLSSSVRRSRLENTTPFMDAANQRYAQQLPQRTAGQQPQRLKRVAKNEGGFGVIPRALMRLLDRRHFLAFLIDFQAIANHDHSPPKP